MTVDFYQDVIFEMPDGRQIVVTVSKGGHYRLMERADQAKAFGPPVFGSVQK